MKAGVIDAAKVTRSALQNAASIAALFLTTEAVIADKPEEKRRRRHARRHARHGRHGRLLSRPALANVLPTGRPQGRPVRVAGRGRVTSAAWTPLNPSVGWGVLHLFYRVDRERAEREPERGEADRRRGRVARGRRAPGAVLRRARPQGRPRVHGARSRPRAAPGVPAGAARRRRSCPRTRTCRSPSCPSTPRPTTTSATRLEREEGITGDRARRTPRGVARADGALPASSASIRSFRRSACSCFYPMSKRRDGRRQLVRCSPSRSAKH